MLVPRMKFLSVFASLFDFQGFKALLAMKDIESGMSRIYQSETRI
jgi:hypothetical protein